VSATIANRFNSVFAAPSRKVIAWGIATLCAVSAIGSAGLWSASRETDSQVDAIRRAIDVHVVGLKSVAATYNYLPFTVAQHADIIALLADPDVALRRRIANRYLEEVNRRAGSDALYVMDVTGVTLASSNWNGPKSFVGNNYSNRPYFIDAFAGRRGQFYGVGQTTGEPGLFIAAPVRRDGTVIGVVAVKVSLRQIQEAWENARDPVVLADQRGVVFLGTERDWTYLTRRALSAEDLSQVRAQRQYGAREEFPLLPWTVQHVESPAAYLVRTTLNGTPRAYLAVDEPVSELGWTLTVMGDYAPVLRARNRAWMVGALGGGVVLLGGLYWQLRERRFREQRDARRELEVRVKERTHELQEAHSFRKAMEDSLLVGMRARDLDGRIVYVNPALCEITGYSADELIGRQPPYPYWHPEDMEKHWEDNAAALSGGAALTGFESRIRHKDGHDVYTMVYTAALIDASGKHTGWMSSVVDISAQKSAEERQRLHELKLQRLDRMGSLGEMVSTLAHELNQPLMAVSNLASAAKAFAAQGNRELLDRSLDEASEQAQRAGEVVQRIRRFVRQRTAGLEPCSLNDVAANTLALMQPEIRIRKARVVRRLVPDLPKVSGDTVLLEQVVLNLILNGLQAMQDSPPAKRLIEIETFVDDGRACLRVTDHGPGIPAEAAAQLFEPFFTTKADGLGLGLNLCRTIVESHRGHLSFEHRPGGGAIFTVQLPHEPPRT
jgi:two-component system, LuxR family, sensor histidine kinase DctS